MKETFVHRREGYTHAEDGLGETVVRRMLEDFPPLQEFEFVCSQFLLLTCTVYVCIVCH